jgi:hypothetical protein
MTLFSHTREYSRLIKNGRTLRDILNHAKSEMKELGEELDRFEAGVPEGEDGIVGEAIDVITCMFDLIAKHCPDITEADVAASGLLGLGRLAGAAACPAHHSRTKREWEKPPTQAGGFSYVLVVFGWLIKRCQFGSHSGQSPGMSIIAQLVVLM